jgi:two-component system, sensor histidine kinase and response regulator
MRGAAHATQGSTVGDVAVAGQGSSSRSGYRPIRGSDSCVKVGPDGADEVRSNTVDWVTDMEMDVKEARILVIDDEDSNLRLLHGVLSPTYDHVEMVSDARNLQDTLVEFSPDVVLVDLHMPHVSGYDVLDAVRNSKPEDEFLPVVVITADVSHEARRRALALGATDFLTKPIDVIEVALRVSNLVRTRFLYRELRDARLSLEVTVAERTQELSDANDRLAQLVRTKDEFIASVSHELRTPLSVVVGLAAELRDGEDRFDAVEFQELLTMVVDQSNDVAAIIEDLLVAARADIGTLTIAPREVKLDSVVARAMAPVNADERSRIEVDLDVAFFEADPVRLTQILRNLITNAVRYGGERIGLGARGDERVVTIEVWDNGEPLDPDIAGHIFEAYYSAHPSQGQPSSVGLGLTVSRNLAQRMGGDLSYRYEDDQSIFRLTLPTRAVTSV